MEKLGERDQEGDEKQRQGRREEGGEDEIECVYMCSHVNA